MTQKIRISEIVAQPHLEHFNDKQTLHQIDKGGRSSCKSSKNEVKIPFLFLKDKTAEAVVVRKVYKDHRDTTFAGLKIGFERLGWKLTPKTNYPEGKNSKMWLKTTQGNYVHFVGLNDYESSKGARPTKLGNEIKILWLFEITQFDSEEEMNQVISNYIRGKKDWFIILYEFNPPAKTTHWVYDWLRKMKQRTEDTYIQHTNYNDLPIQQQEDWLGVNILKEIEALKEIDYEQYKSIYLGLPANLSGTVYKRFMESKHVGEVSHNPEDYMRMMVGVDYGETDATTFTLIGLLKGWRGMRVLKTFYHKNGESQGDYDITEYGERFFEFMNECKEKYGMTFKVYIDSASKHFWNYLKKEKARRGIGGYIIKEVNKRPRLTKPSDGTNKFSSAIEERISMGNIMFGADWCKLDVSCRQLAKALNECERDKNGNRRDDGTTDIDSLDSFEYAWLDDTKLIHSAILRQRGYDREQRINETNYAIE